jgi:hypothetical protein
VLRLKVLRQPSICNYFFTENVISFVSQNYTIRQKIAVIAAMIHGIFSPSMAIAAIKFKPWCESLASKSRVNDESLTSYECASCESFASYKLRNSGGTAVVK